MSGLMSESFVSFDAILSLGNLAFLEWGGIHAGAFTGTRRWQVG